MKKNIIRIFFILHFIFILFGALQIVIFDVIDFKEIDNKNINILRDKSNIILNNEYTDFYKRYSGLNTGYGFFGINVATESYFKVEFYNQGNIICTTTNNNYTTNNTLIRFLTLASSEMNSLSEIESYKKKKIENLSLEENLMYNNKIKFHNKTLKYVGLYNYNLLSSEFKKQCSHYKISQYCLIPEDIWQNKTLSLKKYKLDGKIFYVKNK